LQVFLNPCKLIFPRRVLWHFLFITEQHLEFEIKVVIQSSVHFGSFLGSKVSKFKQKLNLGVWLPFPISSNFQQKVLFFMCLWYSPFEIDVQGKEKIFVHIMSCMRHLHDNWNFLQNKLKFQQKVFYFCVCDSALLKLVYMGKRKSTHI
jgi:hypothetical protein